MYFFNGIVYGKSPEENIKITDVKPLDDKMMIISFSSGEKRLFDASILSGPAFASLDNPEVFMRPAIEHGVITWADGEIDCAPEYMYENSFEYLQESCFSSAS